MSPQTSDNNKRIAKNTLLLYFRMLFMMGCRCSTYTNQVCFILACLLPDNFTINSKND